MHNKTSPQSFRFCRPSYMLGTWLLCMQGITPLQAESLIENNPINRFYSNTELKIKLATQPSWQECTEPSCIQATTEFNALIGTLGNTLQNALQTQQALDKKSLTRFHFQVADKTSLGMLSDASGHVIVFRQLQKYALPEHAMRFLIAREMGHIMKHHHDKNVATKLIISAIAAVVFPAVVLVSASSAAQQASTATTIASNAASTVTSMLGGEVALNQAKPSQRKEADDWALALLALSPQETASLASTLQSFLENVAENQKNSWTHDLQLTTQYLQETIAKPPSQENAQ